MKKHLRWIRAVSLVALTGLSMGAFQPALADPVPGGTLDPTTIPKYVIPLVIPPVMPKSTVPNQGTPAAEYNISMRQFKQQILPGGIWGGTLPATTVWSYGRTEDPLPDSSGIGGAAGVAPATNSSYNYPAFTVEATSMVPDTVRWINGLIDSAGHYLPHLFKVDQTLHWANPPNANCIMAPYNRTDCETDISTPYSGPVPMVTHVHGAHVQGNSDGYPEQWWLPAANNIPAGYAKYGSKFEQADNSNTVPGSAFFSYENTQPATTIWYHDHALGMTRLNVYAGPAGFWLIRGGTYDTAPGVLPGPAPVAGDDPNLNPTTRATIREIPVVIQDRSFNVDGSLFYPDSRSFFDGFIGPYIGGMEPSDIAGIWNPEAFFNTMVVNGTTWPKYEVAPARYRLRLLDGCDSRTINLALFVVTSLGEDDTPGTADDVLGEEIPFYQIGGDQGFLPQVAMITTGFNTALPGDGTIPTPTAAPVPEQALLIASAERADVIIDFSGLPDGTRIRMINTAPDAPFGGFPDTPADPGTTGQVMDFIVNSALTQPSDATTTAPEDLVLPAEPSLGTATVTRQVSLNEQVSDQVCVEIDGATGEIVGTLFSTTPGDPNFAANCAAATVTPGNTAEPMGPRQALLGVLADAGGGNMVSEPLRWMDRLTEIPDLNDTEIWEIFNTTMDAHPIHMHLVRYEVINREDLDPTALAAGNLVPTGTTYLPNPNELGYKDTVIVYPGQMLRLKAKFDIEGLYVWHCHIIEHEDNEMMRPYVVHKRRINADFDGDGKTDIAFWRPDTGDWQITPSLGGMPYTVEYGTSGDKPVSGDYDGDGKNDIAVWRVGTWFIKNSANNTESIVSWGTSGDIPVPGDYDGDGKTDLAVWRDGTWFFLNSADGSQTSVPYGTAGDIPVAADYDGDGKADIAVWRPSDGNWHIIYSSNSSQHTIQWGANGDIPVLGDYDSDGKTDLAVWRNGTWFILKSSDGSQYVVSYGASDDIPVPGNYNVITRTDLAVWRPSSATWYILATDTNRNRTVTFGTSTDQPIKAGQPIQ